MQLRRHRTATGIAAPANRTIGGRPAHRRLHKASGWSSSAFPEVQLFATFGLPTRASPRRTRATVLVGAQVAEHLDAAGDLVMTARPGPLPSAGPYAW